MTTVDFTAAQSALIPAVEKRRDFLEGPVGSGKTSLAAARLHHFLLNGVPAEEILILLPQRTLAAPYQEVLRRKDLPPGGRVSILTIGGLAQRILRLFWPVAAEEGHFARPDLPPTFLTLETAQYYMALTCQKYIDGGKFESIHIDRNRLFSQVLDNLNKAASVGFSHTQIAGKLQSAWIGKEAQVIAYQQAQEVANEFREYCLKNNLLDFSLQLELFNSLFASSFLVREHLGSTFRHLIFDNVEEDIPVTHDLVRRWLAGSQGMPAFTTALLVHDLDGGYRSYLGADRQSGACLREICDQVIHLDQMLIAPPHLQEFEQQLVSRLTRQKVVITNGQDSQRYAAEHYRFYPEMVHAIGQRVQDCLKAGLPANEIALLSPFLSDSLLFSIQNELDRRGIPSRAHRPSRSLRSEPVTHALLTFARLAHPGWNLPPTHQDLRDAFFQCIEGMDYNRADLMAKLFYKPAQSPQLTSYYAIKDQNLLARITDTLGARYEKLRLWLQDYSGDQPDELDLFLSRLFGELLSQKEFAFHQLRETAEVTARLIESVQKFRRVLATEDRNLTIPLGKEYYLRVEEGLLAAQYLESWKDRKTEGVLIMPAYTFLMYNRPVSVQMWLDIGSMGWWQRLYQPLTQPYVLSRHWPVGMKWTDAHEFKTNQENLVRLVRGLVRRCRQEIYLYSVGVNEGGSEERGPLLQAFQGLRRQFINQQGALNE